MLGWLRRRRPAPAIPDDLWDGTLRAYPFLADRPPSELSRLRALASEFLQRKQFQGAGGFVITDQVAVAIAAQAVLPVLHLGLHWYDDFVGIVVHSDEVLARRTVMDDIGVVHHYSEVLSGEAMEAGPVMLSWSDVAGADPAHASGHAYNVVIHEFIHKIDMRDGRADGCPLLRSQAARERWLAVMQQQYEAFRERTIMAQRFGAEPTWLDPYGAQSIDEFFAVACEGYFVDRHRFEQEFAKLALLFDEFFGFSGAAAP